MLTSPVWRLLLSQRLRVERETPKRSWTSFLGMPRSKAESTFNLRSFEYAFMDTIFMQVHYLRKPLLDAILVAVMYVSVVWTRAVCPKRPQVRANVPRDEVSGCGEVPSVGADLDGECGAVAKVENHGLRSVHPAARLDLPVLYGHNRFADGLEDRLQFVLGIWWADYLGVFSATGVLTVHPCSFGFLRTTSTFRHRASYPCLAVSPRPGTVKRRQARFKRRARHCKKHC